MTENMITIAKKSKEAFLKMMNLDISIKNKALASIAKKLEENKEEIFKANEEDLKEAQNLLDNGEINKATFDRLKLNEAKLNDLIKGLNDLIHLDDPINKILWAKELDKDL